MLAAAAAAPAAQSPSFDAASVKKNAGGGPPGMEIRVTPNGGFIATRTGTNFQHDIFIVVGILRYKQLL